MSGLCSGCPLTVLDCQARFARSTDERRLLAHGEVTENGLLGNPAY